jgi:hypothetical protein
MNKIYTYKEGERAFDIGHHIEPRLIFVGVTEIQPSLRIAIK